MSSKKILVITSEETVATSLHELLAEAGFKVEHLPSAAQAELAVKRSRPDAVIADVGTSEIKKLAGTVTVLLLTGSSDLNATLEAYEAGVAGFIAKPVRKDELIDVLSSCLGLTTPASDDGLRDVDFVRINLEEFVVGDQISYDVYIRLTGSKYVKIAHRGENLSSERLETYRTRDVHFLYVQKTDLKKYVAHAAEVASERIRSDPSLNAKGRASLVRHTGEIIVEQLFAENIDEESYSNAKKFVETTVSTLTQDVNALTLLSLLSSHADFVYAHCVAVSFVGTLLARQVEWTSPPNLFKVAMGGLLHDIGLKEVDVAVLSKPRSEYTADEARLYDSHGLRGRDILSTMPNIPTDIIQIVMQHHEDCSGNGTPFGLKRDRIHPLARLLSVADVFCELILKNPNHDGIPPSDAIERMNQLHRGSLDGTFLDALALVFKVAPAVKKAS